MAKKGVVAQSPNVFQWRDGYDQNLIIKKISALRTTSKQIVAYDSSKLGMWFSVLLTAISANENARYLKRTCIRAAIFDSTQTFSNGSQFIAHCNSLYQKFLSSPPKKYIVYFEITYAGPPLFNRLENEWAVIKWAPSARSSFMRTALKERYQLLKEKVVSNKSLNLLSPILVEVHAHKISQAYEQANDSIDLVRGILNLVTNIQMSPKIPLTDYYPHAINRFRIGPEHTLHLNDGTLATPIYWYEPYWVHRAGPVRFSNEPLAVRNRVKREWKRIHQHTLSEHLRYSIIRYCRALDQHDPNLSLLNIWSAIEFTMGSQNIRHETIVRRLERIYSDNVEARQALFHLRHLRNDSAHSGTRIDGEESGYILHHGEQVANDLISFLLNHGKFLESPDEIGKYLDLPESEAELKRRKALHKNARFLQSNRRPYF